MLLLLMLVLLMLMEVTPLLPWWLLQLLVRLMLLVLVLLMLMELTSLLPWRLLQLLALLVLKLLLRLLLLRLLLLPWPSLQFQAALRCGGVSQVPEQLVRRQHLVAGLEGGGACEADSSCGGAALCNTTVQAATVKFRQNTVVDFGRSRY